MEEHVFSSSMDMEVTLLRTLFAIAFLIIFNSLYSLLILLTKHSHSMSEFSARWNHTRHENAIDFSHASFSHWKGWMAYCLHQSSPHGLHSQKHRQRMVWHWSSSFQPSNCSVPSSSSPFGWTPSSSINSGIRNSIPKPWPYILANRYPSTCSGLYRDQAMRIGSLCPFWHTCAYPCCPPSPNLSFARNRIQGQELSELREIHTTRKRRQSGKYNQRLEKAKADAKPKSKRQKVTHSLTVYRKFIGC